MKLTEAVQASVSICVTMQMTDKAIINYKVNLTLVASSNTAQIVQHKLFFCDTNHHRHLNRLFKETAPFKQQFSVAPIPFKSIFFFTVSGLAQRLCLPFISNQPCPAPNTATLFHQISILSTPSNSLLHSNMSLLPQEPIRHTKSMTCSSMFYAAAPMLADR